MTRPRLLLLDGHSLAYRAFFALPVENFATATGQHTNAVYGFTSMLVNVLRDEVPTHVAVAFDKSRQTFRLEEYSEYKAKRNKTPGEFSSQLPLIKRVLDTLHIPHLELDGYEADDIIATLVTQAVAEGMEVLILTGDRDSIQLVTETSTVLYPMRGVSDLARLTPPYVEDKYGVPPYRYPELAAIVGETSDNLPGVPGVGQGYAAKWINQYDGLDNVIARADEITGKKGEALREHLGDVIRNRRLNALVRDLTLPVRPGELARQPWDRTAGARAPRRARVPRRAAHPPDRHHRPRPAGGRSPRPASSSTASGSPPATVAAWLGPRAAASAVGVAVQGSWRAGTGEVVSLARRHRRRRGGLGRRGRGVARGRRGAGGWLADPERPKVLHDAKGPMLALAARGWQLGGLAVDTALAAYLVQPDQRSYDLADLTLRYLKRELRQDTADADQLTLRRARRHRHQRRRDAARAGGARPRRGARRRGRGARRHPAAGRRRAAAGRHCSCGWSRPASRSTPTTSRASSRSSATRSGPPPQDAYDVIGKEINLGSPKQLQVVLFDELDMPKTKRTKTGYTTDADALQ